MNFIFYLIGCVVAFLLMIKTMEVFDMLEKDAFGFFIVFTFICLGSWIASIAFGIHFLIGKSLNYNWKCFSVSYWDRFVDWYKGRKS